LRRSADLACLGAATANNTLVNSCFNAVVLLDVKLRQGILRVCAGIADITKGRCIDDVPDNESLHSLVLRNQFGGGDTTDTLDVAASVLVTSMVSALDGHFEESLRRERVK